MNMEKIFKEILEWSFCIMFALIIALATRYYVIASVEIKQDSMHPYLQEGQRVLLNRLKRVTKNEYERGDIITFEAPTSNADKSSLIAKYDYNINGIIKKINYYILEFNKVTYVKRVIGTSGDKIQIKDGKVYVNDMLLKEEYLEDEIYTKSGIFNELIVPENCIYVLGDNRDNSIDSRWFGCIPLEKVEGKVIFRYWPLAEWGSI